jgi:serine kinase of HPr protein (carbohydrate metabolism regulator)
VTLLLNTTAVAIAGRGVLIEGAPGCGKSSLALALIDRGAILIGDDGLTLVRQGDRLMAGAPANAEGLLEVRNVGLVRHAVVQDVPLCLILRLDPAAPRFIDAAEQVAIAGVTLPLIRLWPESPVLHLRAEAALAQWGLSG